MISKKLYKAFSTGIWTDGGNGPMGGGAGARRNNRMKSGATQLRNITNRITAPNQLNRVMSKINPRSKETRPRRVGNYDGQIDPYFTPEGESAGVIKMTAQSNIRSQGCDDKFLLRWLQRYGGMTTKDVSLAMVREVREMLTPRNYTRKPLPVPLTEQTRSDVSINGMVHGEVAYPLRLLKHLRLLRRSRFFPAHISCWYDPTYNKLCIDTSAGRYMRPLYVGLRVLEYNRKYGADVLNKMTWEDKLRTCLVEYVDTNEEATLCDSLDDFVARRAQGEINLEYVVIHASMILGPSTALIPFGASNMSTRWTSMSGMWAQAMGMYSTQYRMRFDTTAVGFNLVYPERPLIANLADELFDLGSYAMGQNSELATGTWQGAGQDDSMIMNGSDLALGLGLAISITTCTDEERAYGISATGGIGGASARINGDRFCKATSLNCQALRDASYEYVDEDGLPLVGSMIPKERAVVWSKVLPRQRMSSESGDMSIVNESQYMANQEQCQVTHHDKSTVSSQKYSGQVDSCIITTNHKNAKLSKCHFINLRPGGVGDKWTTRHGQKNTCGAIYPEWLMPYDHLGVRVGQWINPQALPSRMTVGELIETLAGLASLAKGRPIDGTLLSKAYLNLLDTQEKYGSQKSFVFDTFGYDEEELRTPLAPEGLDTETEAMTKKAVFEEVLRRMGFAWHGMKALFNPLNGERIGGANTKMDGIFNVGPTYVLRLNRIAEYKMHARSTGAVDALSRQGVEGDAKRYGEMEVACAVAHGAARINEDRMLISSNPFYVHVCARCGWLATANLREQLFRCGGCKEHTQARQVFMPYDAKQLLQMLQVLSLTPTLQTLDVLH